MKTPLRNSAIALFFHVLLLLVLLYGPKWGIYAVVISNILFAVIVCGLNAWSIRRYLNYRQEVWKTFILPLICSIIMGLAALLVSRGLDKILPEGKVWLTLKVIGAVGIAVAVYGVSLLKVGAVNEGELYAMPAGRKMVRVAKRFRLL